MIYLITCKICEIQYVGECTTKWRACLADYVQDPKYASNGQKQPQTEFHKHFPKDDHNGLLSDVEVTLTDKKIWHLPKYDRDFG